MMSGIAADIVDEPNSGPTTQGSVRVSVSEGFGTWFVSQHLAALADLHPRLEIDLVANSGFLNPTRRETDVAVLLARPRKGPLMTRKLTDYGLRLYASTRYLASMPPIRSPDDLRHHRFVGYIPDIVYAPELRYLDEIPTRPTPQLRSSSINAQYRMTAAGAGIGVLPCFIGNSNPGLVVVLPDIHITRSFWLVTHRETRMFPPIRVFTNWLVALIEQHRTLFLDGNG
jgi:DNA-binding transcriptional LysR family regulator